MLPPTQPRSIQGMALLTQRDIHAHRCFECACGAVQDCACSTGLKKREGGARPAVLWVPAGIPVSTEKGALECQLEDQSGAHMHACDRAFHAHNIVHCMHNPAHVL
eukprot:scaffold2266_cov18-Tisochrysis_lutea.AAC.3